MLQYRAAAWMINTHAPEISMGLNTVEELGDVYDAEKTGAGGSQYEVTTAALQETKPAGEPAYESAAPDEAKPEAAVEDEPISPDQCATLETLCDGFGVPMDDLKRFAGVKRLAQIRAPQYQACMDWLNERAPK